MSMEPIPSCESIARRYCSVEIYPNRRISIKLGCQKLFILAHSRKSRTDFASTVADLALRLIGHWSTRFRGQHVLPFRIRRADSSSEPRGFVATTLPNSPSPYMPPLADETRFRYRRILRMRDIASEDLNGRVV
jgi:hypothetical protein